MTGPDPLLSAATTFVSREWGEWNWREFGLTTGTSDIIDAHPRLYRSLSFGDPDYSDAAHSVLNQILVENEEDAPGEKGRMELLSESMPELPSWIEANAPARIKRLLREYLAARDSSEIPLPWREQAGISSHESENSSQAPVDDSPDVYETEPWDLPNPEDTTAPSAQAAPAIPIETAAISSEPSIFIVHGHDEASLNSIRIYVHNETGIMPTSLAEEAGRGATIIEKFESIGAMASFVIVLLTPDDVGQTRAGHLNGDTPSPRARQNVVLELGYFIAKISRRNIVVLDADVERPSDLAGVSYIEYPGNNWKDNLRRELAAAGLT